MWREQRVVHQLTDAAIEYRTRRIAHWDEVAERGAARKDLSGEYHRRLEEVYGFLIHPGQRVIEFGSGNGDLLAALRPSYGVGIDLSPRAVKLAQEAHPHLRFVVADAHSVQLDEEFDVVILSDLVNDLWDVQAVFERLHDLCTPSTRVILNSYSRLWQLPLSGARSLGFARPELPQNWLTSEDLENLLELAGFEMVSHTKEVLWPMGTPVVGPFLNRFLVKLWPFSYLALTNFLVARPKPVPVVDDPVVSVVVPARNEAGHIGEILTRTPDLGAGTELLFVEGNSTDDTYAVIKDAIDQFPDRNVRLLQQSGKGKGDAVRLGFSEATGTVLMILDADMTVPPEDLQRFLEALLTRKGEFINGVRLVYPMEKRAMRYLNLVGNKFFSIAFTWLLQQRIKDTLCGTKVLFRSDYERIAGNRSYFGDFDPFGDFDLLFGAAKLNLKIVDMPIRYRERRYGETNIQRWSHGWLLLRMAAFAARRMRFV